jgi:cysteine desulfurase/selenocysteine lyase
MSPRPAPLPAHRPFELRAVRADFPILGEVVRGKPLVYLDNAATTQKPKAVLDALTHYYEHDNANVHRAVHALSERATKDYDQARRKVQRFVNAKDEREIVFVRGATEAINLVAQTFGRARVRAGDEVVVSGLEHHSNIVPWQMLCEEKNAKLRVLPVTDSGELDLTALDGLLGARTRLLAIGHVSNALGTINPVRELIARAHERAIPVLVDGAQAAPHLAIDVEDLGADFYAFSGHKVYGPTGIGVLYGRLEHLAAMPPWQGGGDMILTVTFEKTTYNEPPFKFEAGTPDIAGAIGLGAALDYVQALGLDAIASHEHTLLDYATRELTRVRGLRIIGTAARKAGVISFVLEGIHPHDLATVVDQAGVAIRSGHHCAQPVMDRFGVPATARASFGLYNTTAEVDALVAALGEARNVFG